MNIFPSCVQKLLEGAANAPENGIYFRGQPEGRLLSWPYVNKNAMYYDSSEQALVPLTDAERAAQVQVPFLLCLISAVYSNERPSMHGRVAGCFGRSALQLSSCCLHRKLCTVKCGQPCELCRSQLHCPLCGAKCKDVEALSWVHLPAGRAPRRSTA